MIRSALALVVAAAAVVIGWRVLAPAEVLDPATTPYPVAAAHGPGVTGRTNMAPLIVDDRIRVYAGKRQVRADGPVDAKGVNTAYWSLRRWPAQVTGVVAAGRQVISHWTDGELIAVDGTSGKIAWRVPTGATVSGFAGHRTGAATVWQPPGLHLADGAVLVALGGQLQAYDVTSGARRWAAEVGPDCAEGFTTAGGQYVCPAAAWTVADGQRVTGWPAGPYAPLSCGVAASGCTTMRDGTGRYWAVTGPRPAAGAPDQSVGGAQLLGTSRGRKVLLTVDRHLVVLDPASGARVADFPLAVGTEKLTWKPGRWQVTDGYVAIERLTADGPNDPEALGHYFTVDTVIIAAI